jgi:1-acyl-sn-glycerol-3-phosphate acyltransferase
MKFYAVIYFLFSRIVRFLFCVKVVGADNLPASGPVILCSNHRSNYDPVLFGISIKRQLRYMAKAELFKFPLLGWLFKGLGAFPVSRGAHDMDAIKTAIKILKSGGVLAMFPEGTRSRKDGEMLPFKSGVALLANRTGATVVPAVIICKGKGRMFKRHLIKIGKPILAEELGFTDGKTEDLRAVSERLRQIVAKLMEE